MSRSVPNKSPESPVDQGNRNAHATSRDTTSFLSSKFTDLILAGSSLVHSSRTTSRRLRRCGAKRSSQLFLSELRFPDSLESMLYPHCYLNVVRFIQIGRASC